MTRAHRVVIAALSIAAVIMLPKWVLQHERAQLLEDRQAAWEEIRRENAVREQENERLREQIRAFSTNGAREERAILQDTDWVRPDEIVVEFRSVGQTER
jgi:cell division protein FtsB